jgi:hypothetical protein
MFSFQSGYQEADANGYATIPVIDYSLIGTDYIFSAVHNMDPARVSLSDPVRATADMDVVRIYVPGTPSRPERPSGVPLETSIDLTWDEPWDGGAYIDYYNVAISNEEHGSFVPVEHGSCAGNIPPAQRSCTVTNLTPGTQYYFAIVAHNKVGYSEPTVYAAATSLARVVIPSPTPEESTSPEPTPMPSAEVTPEPTPTPSASVEQSPTPTPSAEVVAPKPPTSTFLKPATLAKGQQITGLQVARVSGIKVPRGAKVTIKIASISKDVCKVSKGKLVALRGSGSCFATVSVTTAKSKKYPKRFTVKKSVTYFVK